MNMPRLAVLVVLGLILTAPAFAQPTPEQIAEAIEQLSDKRFAVREKASAFLRSAGEAAEPALREASKSDDKEVSRRAGEILSDFKWGIYPNTPAPVLAQIRRYRTGDASVRRATMTELARLGTSGFVVLLKIVNAEETAELRNDLRHFLTHQTERNYPQLLAEGGHAVVEQLLELALPEGDDAVSRNYAAFLLLRNRLDVRLPHFKALAEKPDGKFAARLLAHLYRAKGDTTAALAAAEKTEQADLLDLLLLEKGDWKELARRVSRPERPTTSDEQLGFAAAYQRLAGQDADFEKAIAALRQRGQDDDMHFAAAAKALFLNDRPDEALALLRAKKAFQPAFEALCGQQKYREALALVEPLTDEERSPALQLRWAHFLAHLGAKDRAGQILERLADAWKENENFAAYRDLVRGELRLGMKEPAFRHAAQFLALSAVDERNGPILALLFPSHGDNALVWWRFLRLKQPTEAPADTLKRLRVLLEKTRADEDLRRTCRDVEKYAVTLPLAERGPWLLAAAELCLTAGDRDLGRNLLEKAVLLSDSAAPLQRLGDVLADKKEWAEAAERYRQAWEQERGQPLPLYLQGWALTLAGNEKDGRPLMELAHLLPLADDRVRFAFSQALVQRGHLDAGRRERALLLRLGSGESMERTETLRLTAYDLMAQKQFAQAADTFEQFRLRCLRTDTRFAEYRAYLHVPVLVHQNRARGLLATGKLDEARTEWRLALKEVPGHLDLVIQIVGDLDRAGRKAEADEVFRGAFAVHEKLVADYPRSSTLLNAAAWLCAGCRRQLDKGLHFAEKSVELAPEQASLLDTLAEVHFQRGEKDKALERIKRCRELEPGSEYFRKQQQRIEAGDPQAAVPEDGA